jgi:hypothetical protein
LKALAAAQPQTLTSPLQPTASEAAQAWSLVKNMSDISALEAFIHRFGDTFYGDLAKARLSDVKPTEAAKQAAETAKKKADEEAVLPARRADEQQAQDFARSLCALNPPFAMCGVDHKRAGAATLLATHSSAISRSGVCVVESRSASAAFISAARRRRGVERLRPLALALPLIVSIAFADVDSPCSGVIRNLPQT